MGDSPNSGFKTAVIVAIIGLVGTVVTVVVNNWSKLSNNTTVNKPNTPSTTDTVIIPPKPTTDFQSMAEAKTNDFLTAFKTRDVGSLVNMASVPFYNDHDILTSLADVRARFEQNFAEKSTAEFPLIKSIKIKTIADWKKEGLAPERDRVLSSLTIPDDSYLGIVEFEHDGFEIIFRKVDNDLRVAGIWD